jgi:predicted RNA-binding Zn-ribbon protein involved in translation (DUF1610 family)
MITRCPGQYGKIFKPEEIPCSGCGRVLEIFSDEARAKCPACGSLNCRERLPACVDWCRYAEDCVGEENLKSLKKNLIL